MSEISADRLDRNLEKDMGANHGVEFKMINMDLEDAQEVINHMIGQAQAGQ